MINKELLDRTKLLLGDDYVNAFLIRTSDSRWSISEDEFLSLNWQQTEPHSSTKLDGCVYFNAKLPIGIKAYLGYSVINPDDFDDVDEYRKRLLYVVELREGTHGWELYCNEDLRTRTREAWCILGKHQGQQVIFTAHPGEPKASIKQFSDYTRKELVEKIIEGVPLCIKCVDKEYELFIREKIEALDKFFASFDFDELKLLFDEVNSKYGEGKEKLPLFVYERLPEELKYIPKLKFKRNHLSKILLRYGSLIVDSHDFNYLNEKLYDLIVNPSK